MRVRLRCPHCGKEASGPAGTGKLRARCPYCGRVFSVQDMDQPPTPPAVPPPASELPPDLPKAIPRSPRRMRVSSTAIVSACLFAACVGALWTYWEPRSIIPARVERAAADLPNMAPLEREAAPVRKSLGLSLNDVTDSFGPANGWQVVDLSRLEGDKTLCELAFDDKLSFAVWGPTDDLEAAIVSISTRGEIKAHAQIALTVIQRLTGARPRDVLDWFNQIADEKAVSPMEVNGVGMTAIVVKKDQIWILIVPKGNDGAGGELMDKLS